MIFLLSLLLATRFFNGFDAQVAYPSAFYDWRLALSKPRRGRERREHAGSTRLAASSSQARELADDRNHVVSDEKL